MFFTERYIKKLSIAVGILLLLFMAAVLCAVFMIPTILDYSETFFGVRTQALIFMYVGSAVLLWLLAELFLIMRSVRGGAPFVERNVRALLRIALACALAEADFIFILCFSPRITLIICALIVALGILCALVLSGVFARAVAYKRENDLTV